MPREKADAERRRTLERFKEHQAAVDRERNARETALAAKRNRFSTLNVSEALAAARRLTFVDLEAEGARDPDAAEPPNSRHAGIVLEGLARADLGRDPSMAARLARYVNPASLGDAGDDRLIIGTRHRRIQMVSRRRRFSHALLSLARKRHRDHTTPHPR